MIGNMTKIYSIITVILLLTLSSIIILLSYRDTISDVKGDEPPAGLSEEEEVLPSNTPVEYSEQECYNYIHSFQLINDLKDLNPPQDLEPDPPDEEREIPEYSELIKDNRNCVTYWNFILNKNYLNVQVDSDIKEITFVHNSLISNGQFELSDAISKGQEIIDEFAPEIGTIEPDYSKQVILSVKTDEDNNTETIEGYSLSYQRLYQNIPTSDGILILLDSSGELHLFTKKWNLDMPSDVIPLISDDDAEDIADEYIEINSYTVTELMIIRPNYYWIYGEDRFGFPEGILCWMVITWTDSTYSSIEYGVYVDAITGNVVGGF